MKSFAVAGAVMEQQGAFLFVCNRRRDSSLDWSPPGGIIDHGETPLQALRREVAEETNLHIDGFGDLLYRVQVKFEPVDWQLEAHVYRAESWTGDLMVDDPDGVVIDAEFFREQALDEVLAKAPQWIAEPFRAWRQSANDVPRSSGEPSPAPMRWSYVATRRDPSEGGGFVVTSGD